MFRGWRILGHTGCTKNLLNLCRRYIYRSLHAHSDHILTSSEALRALRPFYMAVHPDLFSQFPREKAVNEDSLKKLNSYLDALEVRDQDMQTIPPRRPKPVDLTFFIHPKFDQEASKGTRAPNTVGISLSAQSMGSAVHDILESCDLSIHINRATRAKLANIKTSDQLRDHVLSTYSHYCSKNNPHVNDEDQNYPDFETLFYKKDPKQKSTHKQTINFEQWLDTNIKVAEANSKSSYHVRNENQMLMKEIRDCYGVKDVRIDVEWTASTLRGHLQAVKEILAHTQVESVLEDYGSDVTVSLGYKNFVDVNGCVHLDCEQTIQQWIQFFQHVKRELEALKEVTVLEKQLEHFLSAKKFERPTSVSPQEYGVLLASYLKQHVNSISNFEDSNRSSATLMLLPSNVVCGGPFIAENGTVVFPPSCSVNQLLDFLRWNEIEIKKTREKHERLVMELNQALEEAQKTLKLSCLTWKPTMTDTQALSGCHQLLKHVSKDPLTLRTMDLEGHCVCLCTYYAVSSDGVIKIPWNFSSSQFS